MSVSYYKNRTYNDFEMKQYQC